MRRAMTLLEVVVASAILAVIALVILGASLLVSDANAVQGTALDMDRDAARFLDGLRRELRQSGYEGDGTPRVRIRMNAAGPAVMSGDTLELHVRKGPDGTAEAWSPPGAAFAGPGASWIAYQASPPVNGRRSISRSFAGGGPQTLIENVQSIEYTLSANSTALRVVLVLVRRGHKAVNGAAPPDVVRTYDDRIAMMNLYD